MAKRMLILGISDDVQISGLANAEGDKQRLAFVRIGNESFIADRILLSGRYLSMASPVAGHFTCGSLRPLSQNILGSRFHHRAAFATCGGRSGHSEAGGQLALSSSFAFAIERYAYKITLASVLCRREERLGITVDDRKVDVRFLRLIEDLRTLF